MRTFAVVNQKGGCGKTTTAINLAGVFAGRGLRTLLVDMDPQGHCAAGLAIPEQRVDLHIGDAMLAPDEKPVDPQRLLWRVSRNLDLAPATLRLAALEAARGELASRPDAESRLKKVMTRFDAQYDICLIDCSPAIGLLAFNALVAADEVIIPVETGFFSLQGASKQVNAIKSIAKRLGVAPTYRLLATMHDPASVLSRDLLDELKRRFATRVIPIVITADQSLREAASFGQPVSEYSRESQGAKDYAALADWLIENALKPGAPRPPESEPASAATEPAQVQVQVVPGISDQALGADSEPALVSTMSLPEPPASPEPAGPSATAPTMSRAADMARRTRNLARAVAIAEAKPTALLSTPAPVSDPFMAKPETRLASAPAAITPTVSTVAAPVSAPAPFAPPAPPAAPQDHPRRYFGAMATPKGVLFVQPISIGASVGVAGDFNQWTPERTPLRPNPATGALEALVEMPPGYAQYRLVVDGRWMPDPFNPVVAPNPFGGSNSVVVVPFGPSDLPSPSPVLQPAAARSAG
ncbi:MAG TPA: AAA family ATPase [Phycisphaerales bacterium]|nr:AAA family ATPase [Phycisphaerales bacterium]